MPGRVDQRTSRANRLMRNRGYRATSRVIRETTSTGGGGGLSDGDYGDIVVSGGGTTLNLDSGVAVANIGYTPYNVTNPAGYISSISGAMVTAALGYTPYDAANPAGYITSAALTGYLPLTGGTLSGPLTGTTIYADGFDLFAPSPGSYGLFRSGGTVQITSAGALQMVAGFPTMQASAECRFYVGGVYKTYIDAAGLTVLGTITATGAVTVPDEAYSSSWNGKLEAPTKNAVYDKIEGGAGTSFPGSPATGDRFFRTDRGIEYFYDGTRWLSTQVFELDGWAVTTPTFPYTATGEFFGSNPWAGVYDIYVETFKSATYLTTTPASNYFTLTLNKVDPSNTITALGAIATNTNTINTWTVNSTSIGAVVTSTYPLFYIQRTETGAANFYCMPVILYRLVG